jgi:hypothetical protein
MIRPSARLARCVRVGFVVALIGASTLWSGSQQAVQAQIDLNGPQALELVGGGEDLLGLMNTWGVDWMMNRSDPAAVQVSFNNGGTRAGFDTMLAGDSDFTVSSQPMSAGQQAIATERGMKFVTFPLAVSGGSFLLATRTTRPFEVGVQPADPEAPFDTTRVDGPLKLRWPILARLISVRQRVPLAKDPDFTFQFPAGSTLFGPDNASPPPAATTVRSDDDASNLYLTTLASKVPWSSIPGVSAPRPPATNWLEPSDHLAAAGGLGAGMRTDALMTSILSRSVTTAGGTGSLSDVIVMLPPAVANEALAKSAEITASTAADKSFIYQLQVENARGEWLLPTPGVLTKTAQVAFDANKGQIPPMWALTDKSDAAAGAYPLTWLVNMVVPATGLSAEKTTALATFIRLAASDRGQQFAADQGNVPFPKDVTPPTRLGMGQLPAPLRQQALAAADSIVASNCPGSGGTISSVADGGPYWPSKALKLGGPVKICVPPPTPPADSVATASVLPRVVATSAPTAVYGAAGTPADPANAPIRYSATQSALPYVPTVNPLAPIADPPATPQHGSKAPKAAPGSPVAAGAVAAKLPLPLPDDGRQTVDRLATMLLGGLAFVMVRAAFRRNSKVAS